MYQLEKSLIKRIKNKTRARVLGYLLAGVQAMLGVGMTNYVTLAELGSEALPHMIFAENLLGQFGVYWMGIVTLLAGVSTVNTVLGSVGKILSGMAQDECMPKIFAKKNKNKVPIGGLILIFGGNFVLLATGFTQSSGLSNILLAASCFWLTSYILVNISVLVLRKKYPDMPGRNKKLTLFGIPQFLCIAGNLFMIWNIAEGDARTLIYKIFFILLALLVTYSVVWVKIIKKMPLFHTPDVHALNLKNEAPVVVIEPKAVIEPSIG